MNKIIKLWLGFFFVDLLSVMLQVWDDVSSANWLDEQCNINEEFRKNIKAECIHAAQRMKSGRLNFIINEVFGRVRWCFRYSCVELYQLAFSDFKSLFLLILCSPIVLQQLYKSVYFVKNRIINKQIENKTLRLRQAIENE